MNPLVIVRQVRLSDGTRAGRAYMWCPACDDLHGVGVSGDDGSQPEVRWDFDGDLARPTFSPSIKVTGVQWEPDNPFHGARHRVKPGAATCCHSFLKQGRWQFLADCTHDLAGQTVDMVPLPDWMCEP